MHGINLHWLPENHRWAEQLAEVAKPGSDEVRWAGFVALAQHRLSALQTIQLNKRLTRAGSSVVDRPSSPTRLAILASSTVDHLIAGIQIGGLRRSIAIDTYTPDYGQYAQDLLNADSGLYRFRPTTILFALDAYHLMQGITPDMTSDMVAAALEQLLARLETQWHLARRAFAAHLIQNIPLPLFLPTLGNNEHRLPGSHLTALRHFTSLLRARADAAAVDLVALDDRVSMDGQSVWHDPALWYRAKQEIHPQAVPLYGDLVARLIGAAQGRSSKCLVLDLDNTLWGGVIGDDGLAGIKLGHGSARGEAHLAFQHYVKDLSRRGIILAVCSKNNEAAALEPFIKHPEMVLRQEDIACFVANWNDKAANLRLIAARLNIGLDSLVFADDNPAERAIVRRELPTVSVPELPEDPTFYASCLANSGYFEALRLTTEDSQRVEHYRQNVARETLHAAATDMEGYLRSLEMRAVWDRFNSINLPRVVQLINKTNQFNLTTRRVSEFEIEALISDPSALTLQVRLLDQFGDNGIVAIVFGLFRPDTLTIHLDTWLMSCRVLGRGMEEETLNLVVAEALRIGASRLVGLYRPTPKNELVRDHYKRLGFSSTSEEADGSTTWTLDLSNCIKRNTFITSEPAWAGNPLITPA